ncbi:hypothetical protein B0H11DRAFT_1987562 [Mycena galericulata]|nr:hypothetical protein B0H11DRAFT_1987562 [Mycena galericulata]
MSLASLPAHLHYELFLYLPDFLTLNSLISTSRSFNAVFLSHRDLVLKSVAENFLGFAPLGEEMIGDSPDLDSETATSNMFETIKFLLRMRSSVEALEPIVFRLLTQQDASCEVAHPCLSLTESVRFRRAAYRFAKFCALPSEQQQSHFLTQLMTIEAFELAHFVDGLRKMVSVLDGEYERAVDFDDGRVSHLVSTGPANIWRLWSLCPAQTGEGELAKFQHMMDAAAAGTDEGAFDEAFHHFEIIRNISAFDVSRTHALLDVGRQHAEEALSQLETLMHPPSPLPRPVRPRFRSLKLPLCDNKKIARLAFLPDDLNNLPIRSDFPYCTLALNGEPRILPLNRRQLAELVNGMHL